MSVKKLPERKKLVEPLGGGGFRDTPPYSRSTPPYTKAIPPTNKSTPPTIKGVVGGK